MSNKLVKVTSWALPILSLPTIIIIKLGLSDRTKVLIFCNTLFWILINWRQVLLAIIRSIFKELHKPEKIVILDQSPWLILEQSSSFVTINSPPQIGWIFIVWIWLNTWFANRIDSIW